MLKKKKKKKKSRGSRFRCMRFLCSVFSSVKVVACQLTPQRVPGKEFARNEREREFLYSFAFLLISLLYRLICQMVFPKRNDDDKREDGHTLPTTSKIEKRKKMSRPPLFFLFLIHSSIYHHFDPRLVVYHNFPPTESEKEAEEINETSKTKKKISACL